MRKGAMERNWDPLPHLQREGYFTKQLPIGVKLHKPVLKLDFSKPKKATHWSIGVSPWNRLYSHHTLCSVRHGAHYRTPFVPHDELDIVLNSTYKHNREHFPEKVDCYFQPETHDITTWRVLKNERFIPASKIVPEGHPIVYGGCRQKKSEHSVKLGIGSFHAAQTNAGYSRKVDGTYYSV